MNSRDQMPQTDQCGLFLENEGGAPVLALVPISEEPNRTRLPEEEMIAPGTILVEEDAQLPSCVHVQGGSYPNEWRRAAYDLAFGQMEDALPAAGWTFFYWPHRLGRQPSGLIPLG